MQLKQDALAAPAPGCKQPLTAAAAFKAAVAAAAAEANHTPERLRPGESATSVAAVAKGAVSCLLGDWKKWQDTPATMQLLDTLLDLSGLWADTVRRASNLVSLLCCLPTSCFCGC